MNVLLRPYSREERIPDQLLLGLRSYNSNDGFGRAGGDQLNFAAPSEDEADYPPGNYLKKGKVSRQDPMSHRIIEKRRRDRMNNCLADLSRLIPPEYLKKGRGRVEKTEIIEMAIRHLKYLQDRVNAGDRASEEAFRAGCQEAAGEATRFLVEVRGYEPGDGLCLAMNSHLQRHVELVTKGENIPREPQLTHPGGSSSETSSSSSHGYGMKPGVIQPPPAPPPFSDQYEPMPEPYAMECDRVPVPLGEADAEGLGEEPLALDGRRKRSPTLRAVRKPDHGEDYLHSYKFKNSIERRFSRSQDNECQTAVAADMSRGAAHAQGKLYSHKRRRGPRPALPAPCADTTSTSASASTEEARDTSPQDTSSESPHHHHHYEKPALPPQYVSIFALNEIGKFYVPLSVEYSCLARHGGAGALAPRAAQLAPPLHPVSIHVNFHACLDCHVKRELVEREWQPT